MPYVIDIAAVKDGFSTTLSDVMLNGIIAVVNQADACMTRKNVPDELGIALKLAAARHFATINRDGGSVISEHAVSGASRAYSQQRNGETGFLDFIRTADSFGCVYRVVSQNGYIQLRSIGRNPENEGTF